MDLLHFFLRMLSTQFSSTAPMIVPYGSTSRNYSKTTKNLVTHNWITSYVTYPWVTLPSLPIVPRSRLLLLANLDIKEKVLEIEYY